MHLSERKRNILGRIAQSPRIAKYFTQDQLHQAIRPDVIERLLLQMAEYGLLYEENGVYHITQLGRNALDKKQETTTMRQMDWKSTTYRSGQGDTPIYQRPGSDHSHIKSVG